MIEILRCQVIPLQGKCYEENSNYHMKMRLICLVIYVFLYLM